MMLLISATHTVCLCSLHRTSHIYIVWFKKMAQLIIHIFQYRLSSNLNSYQTISTCVQFPYQFPIESDKEKEKWPDVLIKRFVKIYISHIDSYLLITINWSEKQLRHMFFRPRLKHIVFEELDKLYIRLVCELELFEHCNQTP